VGCARGTQVEANALFFNVPVRRKFLKSDATELSRIVRVVTHCAIAHPAVRFRLEHDGRELLHVPAASDLAGRVAQIYGDRQLERLLPFSMERGGARVSGFLGRPVDAVQRRDTQHLFVNGRPVEDRILSHAVSQALENVVARGLYPPLLLFVEVDPTLVDVNTHPRKTEVRFTRTGEVHDLVRDAVASSLSAGAAVPTLEDLRPAAVPPPPAASIGAAALRYLDANEPAGSYRSGASTAIDPRATAPFSRPTAASAPEPRELLDVEGGGRRAKALAQLMDSYILAQAADALLVVDQHVAHERILFESYLAEADANQVSVQKLLFPVTIDLDPAEAVLVEEEAPELLRLGFVVEPFGGNSVRLDGVPSFAATVDPTSLLRAVLGDAARIRSSLTGVGAIRRRLVTTAACHAAIKINHPLRPEGMQRLLDDLFRTENPTSCPHGRPILFRVSMEEIERAFRRR
jgi:DNA mismatch repair protein MutL